MVKHYIGEHLQSVFLINHVSRAVDDLPILVLLSESLENKYTVEVGINYKLYNNSLLWTVSSVKKEHHNIYLWTYDLYDPVRNAFDAGKSITRQMGRGWALEIETFLDPVKWHRAVFKKEDFQQINAW
jgi:hypothetical protein